MKFSKFQNDLYPSKHSALTRGNVVFDIYCVILCLSLLVFPTVRRTVLFCTILHFLNLIYIFFISVVSSTQLRVSFVILWFLYQISHHWSNYEICEGTTIINYIYSCSLWCAQLTDMICIKNNQSR